MNALAANVGGPPLFALCAALEVPRSTLYRHRRAARACSVRAKPPRALSEEERGAIREHLHSERFVDGLPPPSVIVQRGEGEGEHEHEREGEGEGPPGPEGFPLVNARVVNGGGVVQAAGNSSSVTGGAWARRVESGSARKPRCSRIFFATSGSSMQAMRRILP